MFLVFYKDKIISYIISFSTVAILLGFAFFVRSESKLLESASNKNDLPIISILQGNK
jgi:hypothetical protein